MFLGCRFILSTIDVLEGLTQFLPLGNAFYWVAAFFFYHCCESPVKGKKSEISAAAEITRMHDRVRGLGLMELNWFVSLGKGIKSQLMKLRLSVCLSTWLQHNDAHLNK